MPSGRRSGTRSDEGPLHGDVERRPLLRRQVRELPIDERANLSRIRPVPSCALGANSGEPYQAFHRVRRHRDTPLHMVEQLWIKPTPTGDLSTR